MTKIFTLTHLIISFVAIVLIGGVSFFMISFGIGRQPVAADQQKFTNHLINEKSPYLLQHAHNPVDWYPWGDEAFEKAKKENKPIFLSIGYSTCHWCHVMNEESFSHEDIGKLMNDAFVSIKVDREERPDIDNVYMNVSVMMTGSGGWPLTIIMTPDKKPFYVGTYIPREARFGQPGLVDLIPKIKDAWLNQHDKILNSADKITESLRKETAGNSGKEPDASTLKTGYQQLLGRFDEKYGGFGTGTKFPSPHNLLFLLRYWKRTGEPKALSMVEKTLSAMRSGGMYDHIGFGFHRYSTEPTWRIPHFEKMLYDQAMLAMAYTEAFQATGKSEYAQTANEILTYVMRDMTAPNGGFYSAEDADSEGQEGKFYLWTDKEIHQILKKADADLFIRVFGIEPDKDNILYLKKPLSETAAELKLPVKELENRLRSSRDTLFAIREKRIHPHKDDKILTDWNGLMIAAFAKAAQVFDEPKYTETAQKATDFILKNLRGKDGRLIHRFRDGQASINAHADDYAFLTWGLLELYEANFDTGLLQTALDLNSDFDKHFWDAKDGGYYFTADDGEELLTRQKEVHDGAYPSANSVAVLNLLRLGRITANADFDEKAAALSRAFGGDVKRQPSNFSQLLSGVDFGIGPSYEVVVVGNSQAEDTKAMLKALRSRYVPNKIVLLKSTEKSAADISRIAEFTQYQSSRDGKATAFVCLNYACKLPTTDIAKMLASLQ